MKKAKDLIRAIEEKFRAERNIVNFQKDFIEYDMLLAILAGASSKRQARKLISHLRSELPSSSMFSEQDVHKVLCAYFALQWIVCSKLVEDMRVFGIHGFSQDLQFEFVDMYADLSQFSLLFQKILSDDFNIQAGAVISVALRNLSRSLHWKTTIFLSQISSLDGIAGGQEQRESWNHMLETLELLWRGILSELTPQNDQASSFLVAFGPGH